MSQVGESVEVCVLGDPGNALATGEIAAILAPATAEDSELVELNTGVIGHVRPQQANVQHQFSAANALMPAPVTVSDIPVSGAHLRIGSHVEVQRLDSQNLEYGRVADVFDATPGTQPIVKLVSGTVGAVTCMEAPRLPDHATCLHLLRSNPLIIATPLGASYTVLCHVTSVLDSQGPAIIVTGHVPAPQPSPHAAPPPPDEITAALTSFIVPFTPSPSLRSSAAPTPEPGEFPLLLSPSPDASRGHPEAHLSDPVLPRAPTQAAHPMGTPVAAAARGYSSAVSPSGSPAQSASPNLSATGSYNGVDALRAHAGTPPFQPRGVFAVPPGSPPRQPGAEAGAVSAVRDLGFGMRALAVDTPAGQDGVPQRIMPSWQEIETGGAQDGAVGRGASPERSPARSIVEHAADEEAWAEAQAERDLAPKLAVLREQCQKFALSWDRAETLVMLIEDATVPQIVDTLQKYSDSFEAAANHLLNAVANNRGLYSSGPGSASSHGHDRDPQDPPWEGDAGPRPAAASNATSAAAARDAWGGDAAPPRRRKKRGKALVGCFQAVPTPYAGAVTKPVQRQTLASMVKAGVAPEPGSPRKARPAPLRTAQSKRAAVASAFDDSLPDFLLPFIAEHVRALEAAAGPVPAAPRRDASWTKVKAKRSPEGKAPRTAASLVTLQSTQFREQCLRELGLIAERMTERLRLLTLCSTAANQGRLYDKSAVHRLEDCTSWINRAKESVVKAHIIAARNTRLTNVPGVIDLHLMDRPTAEQVVQGCIYELQRNLQYGDVQIITGKGNHSHNNKANLKPLVLELLADAGLAHSMMDRNPGMVVMHVRP